MRFDYLIFVLKSNEVYKVKMFGLSGVINNFWRENSNV